MTAHPKIPPAGPPGLSGWPGAAADAPGTAPVPPLDYPGGGTGAQLAPGMAKLAAAMSESELDRNVRIIALDLGLLIYHTFDSRRSEPGFPDLVIVGRGVLYRELKRENGRVTQAQKMWLSALTGAGQDACVWRPSDLIAGRIARKLAAISGLGAR